MAQEKEFELREQDRWLPIANVARLMKNTLPPTAKVSKDAKECMQECVSEFISFVTSEASDRCLMEKRKTINGEDILYSLHTLGFENYAEVLKIYLAKFRQQQALKQERGEIRSKKKKKKPEANSNENDHASIIEGNESVTNDSEGNTNQDNGILQNTYETNNEVKEQSKAGIDQEYVSQLYEQGYADAPLNISNPDYHGGGSSESILLKRKQQLESTGKDDSNLEDETTEALSLGLGVGIAIDEEDDQNVEVPTKKSVEISDKSTKETLVEKKEGVKSMGDINDLKIESLEESSLNKVKKEDSGTSKVSKTPATTTAGDLFLLNDNIEGISEREEIVGLTNGHQGMFFN
ncbi:hypothetical protein CANINC_000363 [Pichia inconspicua]|uniref:Transcription factor CBF/NF-Y/archaeal histone domain-containing protein n=1 Tax=Pichia inconspicua TaxID=52247 RepID=A0A4T0X6S2_9ASCO|nr:hypothetical protein CANINC_000363 [[Candida] inconspicua]